MLFIRFLPISTSLLTFLIFEILFLRPKFIWVIIFILLAMVSILLWYFTGGDLRSREFWHLLPPPLFLILGAVFFNLFLEVSLIGHFLALGVSLLGGLFLGNVFLYFRRSRQYAIHSIENVTSYINLISLFLIYSSFYAVTIFLHPNLSLVVVLAFLVTIIILYADMWVSQIPLNKSGFIILILSLIMIEFFWVMTFLPLAFYVNGIILATLYYVSLGLAKNSLKETLEKKIIWRYLIISFLTLFLVLGTARWT